MTIYSDSRVTRQRDMLVLCWWWCARGARWCTCTLFSSRRCTPDRGLLKCAAPRWAHTPLKARRRRVLDARKSSTRSAPAQRLQGRVCRTMMRSQNTCSGCVPASPKKSSRTLLIADRAQEQRPTKKHYRYWRLFYSKGFHKSSFSGSAPLKQKCPKTFFQRVPERVRLFFVILPKSSRRSSSVLRGSRVGPPLQFTKKWTRNVRVPSCSSPKTWTRLW